jgi:hypothetical protein
LKVELGRVEMDACQAVGSQHELQTAIIAHPPSRQEKPEAVGMDWPEWQIVTDSDALAALPDGMTHIADG